MERLQKHTYTHIEILHKYKLNYKTHTIYIYTQKQTLEIHLPKDVCKLFVAVFDDVVVDDDDVCCVLIKLLILNAFEPLKLLL